jgi:hypothetical protein
MVNVYNKRFYKVINNNKMHFYIIEKLYKYIYLFIEYTIKGKIYFFINIIYIELICIKYIIC